MKQVLFNKNHTHKVYFIFGLFDSVFSSSQWFWAMSTQLHKTPSIGNIWAFCTTWEKGPEMICFPFLTLDSDVWCCVDTSHVEQMLGKNACLLSKPMRLRWEVCQSLSTSGTKQKIKKHTKKSQNNKKINRRSDGMDASQIMHFLSFLV